MSALPPSSPGSRQDKHSRRPPTKRHRSEVVKMETMLADWTESSHSNMNTGYQRSGSVSTLANTYIYPVDVRLDDVQTTFAHTAQVYPASTFHSTGLGLIFDGQYPQPQEQLAARRLTVAAVAGLPDSDGNQKEKKKKKKKKACQHHRRSTSQRSAGMSSYVVIPDSAHDVDRHTQGQGAGVGTLYDTASYSSWDNLDWQQESSRDGRSS